MRKNVVFASLLGATSIYVVMAACGGSSSAPDTKSSDGSSSGATPSGPFDAFVDQMMQPVPDAIAGPTPPDVAYESCVSNAAGMVAEHAYPGKTMVDLSGLRAVVHFGAASSNRLTGANGAYENSTSWPVYVRDGAAAVLCSNGIDTVMFVLPQ